MKGKISFACVLLLVGVVALSAQLNVSGGYPLNQTLTTLGVGTAANASYPVDILTANATPARITSANQTCWRVDSALVNADWRNWAICTNVNAGGDIVFMESAAQGGDPLAGNSRLSILNDGTVKAHVTTQSPLYTTATNCADSAGAAACGAAAAGAVVIDAGATTVVVSTTAVTANSQIFVQEDSSLGTRLGITCNATPQLNTVSARTAATSFTITTAVTPAVNARCYDYFIVN